MNKNKEKIISISAIVIIIDQLSKLLVSTKLSLTEELEVIPKFFSIIFIKNKGAAFSILQDQKILLVIISLIVLFIINKYIDKTKVFSKNLIISLGFIIGGIIGNLIDRLIQDGVIDFLSFNIGKIYFPIFNLADAFIVIGIALLILVIIEEEQEEIPIREKLSDQVEIIKVEKTTPKKKKSKKKTQKKKTKK